jgi:Flp pilus assembly protein TadD
MRLLAGGAEGALALIENPPLITGLTVRGSLITIHSYITGVDGPVASWNGTNLHIVMVLSLALVLSVETRNRARRGMFVAVTFAVLSLFMVVITVVQLKTVMETYATTYLGMTVLTPAVRRVLEMANRALIMIGMVLAPVILFLFAYVFAWTTRGTDRQGTDRDRAPDPRAGGAAGRSAPRRTALWVALPIAISVLAWLALYAVRPHGPASRAEEGLRWLLALNQGSAQPRFSLGLYYENEGRQEDAIEWYRGALEIDADLVGARFGLANALFRRAEYEQAIREYSLVVEAEPAHASAHHNLGKALYEMGRYEEALRAYEETLRLNSRHASARNNLGVVLMRLGRPCDALPQFEASAELDRMYAADLALRAKIVRLGRLCGEGE